MPLEILIKTRNGRPAFSRDGGAITVDSTVFWGCGGWVMRGCIRDMIGESKSLQPYWAPRHSLALPTERDSAGGQGPHLSRQETEPRPPAPDLARASRHAAHGAGGQEDPGRLWPARWRQPRAQGPGTSGNDWGAWAIACVRYIRVGKRFVGVATEHLFMCEVPHQKCLRNTKESA